MGFKCLLEVMVLKANFKYINKKIIAGLMAGTIMLSLSGCGEPKYKEITTGIYELDGSVSLNDLKKYLLLELKINDKTDLYLAYEEKLYEDGTKINNLATGYYYEYINVFDKTVLYTYYRDNQKSESVQNENTLINVYENIEDYLVQFNEIKSSYTKEDLERILNRIKQNWQYNENNIGADKQKVKE